jgi:hypothetical protein
MQRKYLSCLIAATVCACVDTGPPEPKIDPAYIQKNLLSAPPAQMTNQVDADFGGKVVYLGNDVSKDTVSPGDEVTVVHYWKVVDAPGERWRVFTHLQGRSKDDWENIDRTDMRLGHGPETWKTGEIVRDEHKFRVPKDWKSPYADVLVGLYPKGQHGVQDRMPLVSGKVEADAERRVPVVRLKISGAGKVEKPQTYAVHKIAEPIVIDGRADEAAWQRAPESPVFSTAEGSPEVKGDTRARLLWDDENLYVFVSAKDSDVHSQYRSQDEPLWKEDVIELFIDADRNRRGYVELQVNPNNAQLDSWFVATRSGMIDAAWAAGMRSAVQVHGTLDNRDDTDTGWDVEIAIPLGAVKGAARNMPVNIPPVVGDTWRLNIVRVDQPKDERNPSVSSWSRITYQDFHALDRMLEVTFGDTTGKTEAPPAAPAEGAAPAGGTGAAPAEGAGATPAGGAGAAPAGGAGAAPAGGTGATPAAPAKPGAAPAQGTAPAGQGAPAGKAAEPARPAP